MGNVRVIRKNCYLCDNEDMADLVVQLDVCLEHERQQPGHIESLLAKEY